MNIVLGNVAVKSSDVVHKLNTFGDDLEDIYPRSIIEIKNNSLLLCSSQDGVVLGFSENDEYTLVCLGWIYRHETNVKTGSSFIEPDKTASFLLDRYVELGEAFLDNIAGQYSIVIKSKKTNSVLLANDPFSSRTWFYLLYNNEIIFSTNMSAVANFQKEKITINKKLEDFMLIYGFYPNNNTPFNEVLQNDSGSILQWDDGLITRRGIVYDYKWAEKYYKNDMESSYNESDIVDLLYDSFLDALREQTQGVKKVAVLLGGFDSALVASALVKIGKEVETFSFFYDEDSYNQPHTDTLSRHADIRHNWIKITEDIFIDGLKNFSKTFNYVTNWPNYVIQTNYLCEEISKRGIMHCYTGDGCDSVFMGYPGTYQRAKVLDRLPVLPKKLVNILLALLGWRFLDRVLGHPYRVALNLIRSLGRTMPSKGFLSFRVMDELSVKQLKKDSVLDIHAIEGIRSKISEPYSTLSSLRLAYLGKAAVSPNNNKMIGSSDANGMIIMSPYLHPGLKKLALMLPDSMCRPEDDGKTTITGKYILMKMAEVKGLLPKEVIYQPKLAGVDAPVDYWYANKLNKYIVKLASDLPFDYSKKYITALSRIKLSETLFKKYILTDNVISHALSLVLTYASFAAILKKPKD